MDIPKGRKVLNRLAPLLVSIAAGGAVGLLIDAWRGTDYAVLACAIGAGIAAQRRFRRTPGYNKRLIP